MYDQGTDPCSQYLQNMNSRDKETIAILRQHVKDVIPLEEVSEVKKMTLEERQILQYKEYLKNLDPIIYKKQD